MGLCGELAAQNDYVPLLMALGFKELSVSPGSLLKTRAKVCKTSVSNSLQLLDLALKAQSSGELKQLLKTLI
jgi:phosphoenolpyruvate-protein kinase (PTS system EI component)